MRTVLLLAALTGPIAAVACGDEEARRRLGEVCGADDQCASGFCLESVCLDPQSDEDGDGLSNGAERLRGTSPFRVDSDGDGVPDADETGPGDADATGDTGHDDIEHRPTDGAETTSGAAVRITPLQATACASVPARFTLLVSSGGGGADEDHTLDAFWSLDNAANFPQASIDRGVVSIAPAEELDLKQATGVRATYLGQTAIAKVDLTPSVPGGGCEAP